MNGNSCNIKILIAAHKKYKMPNDLIYLPIHVGAEGKKDEHGNDLDLGYTKDNTGCNISIKNPIYCELTGIYWAWKNLDADYIGLVHYRRHFSMKRKSKIAFENILRGEELNIFIPEYKIFVPKKRRYYIETLYSHYSHTFHSEQLDITKKIITEKYPDYLNPFDKVMKQTYGHMFNMMIMERNYYDSYCRWLFDILFELEKQIDTSKMTDFHKRYCGRVSEILFNVWLDYQIKNGNISKSEIKEIPYIHMEKISWLKKGTAFLTAKFFNKKYNASF